MLYHSIHVLSQGDLHQYLKEKGALSPSTAINFALDIARYCKLPFAFLATDGWERGDFCARVFGLFVGS